MGTRYRVTRTVRLAIVLVAALLLLGALASSAGATSRVHAPGGGGHLSWSPSLVAFAGTSDEARATAARPYISRLSTSSGKPGARVTVIGRNFGKRRGKGTVTFGVFKCVKYIRWSTKRIICKVPVIPSGNLTLKVHAATRASNGKRFTVKKLPTVVPETTEVLTDATLAGASTTDGSTFDFTDTSETSALSPGDAIVGEPTTALPDGIFRRVTDVTAAGGSVTTEPATLKDVFTRAQFSADHPITQDDFASATLPAGMSLVRSRAQSPELITLRFKEVGVSDDLSTDFGPAALSGTITLKITMHVGGAIDWGGVKSFEMSVTTMVSSDLRASSSLSASVGAEKEWEIAKIPGFTVMAGPVPLYFQPKLAIVVGVEGEVSKGLTTSVHEEISGGIGLTYQSGKFTPWTHFKTNSSYQPPTVTTTCSLKAFAGAKLGLKLYGLAGPYIKLDGFAKLSANVSKAPWWKLSAGIEAAAGVEIGGNYGFIKWGLDWQSGNLTIAEWTLAKATTPPPEPTPPASDVWGVWQGTWYVDEKFDADGPIGSPPFAPFTMQLDAHPWDPASGDFGAVTYSGGGSSMARGRIVGVTQDGAKVSMSVTYSSGSGGVDDWGIITATLQGDSMSGDNDSAKPAPGNWINFRGPFSVARVRP